MTLPLNNAGFYRSLVSKTLVLLAPDRLLVVAFLILSLLMALTEGVGVAMIVPIIGVEGGRGALENIPLIGTAFAPFFELPTNERLMYAAGALAVVLVLRGIIQFYTQLLSALLPIRLQYRLSSESYSHLIRARYDTISRGDHGHMITQLRDFPVMVGMCVKAMVDAIVNLMLVAIYVALMLLVSWPLTLAAIAFMGVIFIILKRINEKHLLPAGQALGNAYASLNRLLQETVLGLKLVRLQTAEPQMQRRFDVTNGELYRTNRRMAFIREFQNPLSMTLAGLLVCGVMIGGSIFAGNDSSGLLAMVGLFIVCLFRMLAPATRISACHGVVTANAAGFDSLAKFQATAIAARERSGGIPFRGLESGIVFENVSFGYGNSGKEILSAYTLSIAKGSMVALVGPSGAGKSTVLNLICRLFDPVSGRILIDGTDIRELNIRDWRQRVSVVSQDIVLFNDTVANNLALGFENVTRSEIEEAARAAAADEFIRALPQGYDTQLGDRGATLSGGQQQRLALARAFLMKPDVLLLDEATSQLDSITEEAVQKAIRELRGKATIIVVAHRLSTVQTADEIVVMNGGRVLERGGNSNLVAAKGAYWRMLKQQQLALSASS